MESSGTEFSGKTVEEAIEAGLAALKLKKNQVTIEVLSKGSRGLLGFGAEDALVRMTPIAAETVPSTKPAAKPKPTAAAKPTVAPKQPAPKAEPQPASEPDTAPDDDLSEVAVELLQGLLDHMGVAASVQVVAHRGVLDAGQEPPVVLNIEGDDLGVLIGRRGETLAALQYLLRLMVNHRLHRWANLVVDVENYKARREETLRKLALRTAERAISSGRAVVMEAMPARERRIIHITLREHGQVTTQSVGEGDSRKVTVIPKD